MNNNENEKRVLRHAALSWLMIVYRFSMQHAKLAQHVRILI